MNISWHAEALYYMKDMSCRMVSFQNEQLGWVKKDDLIQIFRFLQGGHPTRYNLGYNSYN